MYKPNFCAECGVRVERGRWRVWTSRKFCKQCARRFQRSQILLAIISGVMLFGLGLVIGRGWRQSPPPLIVERGDLAAAPLPLASKEAAKSEDNQNVTDAASPPQPEPVYGPDGTATERPTETDETISICGARTQKGTPCRRRVRGTGRCWQHKGMPAIIRNTVIN